MTGPLGKIYTLAEASEKLRMSSRREFEWWQDPILFSRKLRKWGKPKT